VNSYDVYWDAGSGGAHFEELVYASRPFTFYIYSVPYVQPGNAYQFMYRGTNFQGTGPFSDPSTIYAADYPNQCASLTTANQGGNVVVTWAAPNGNGLPIIRYMVSFQAKGGSYFEDTVNCNGQNVGVVAGTSCLIPI